MNSVRVIYHLARADFLERVRRYSFLIMLGLAAFLGYQVVAGHLTLRLDQYRGEFNSAWVGSMMTLISTFFIGLFGFYLVKGSVARDRETGVGQIIATTPLSRPLYTFGKWASNFAVLMAMNLVLALAGVGIQLLAGENLQLDLASMFAPFVFIAMPMMALIAALAVLFETVGFLSGGFGSVVYFFLFTFTLPLSDLFIKTNPAFEPLGLRLLSHSMGVAAKAAFPEYTSGFVLGDPNPTGIGVDRDPASFIFHWPGVAWTGDIILARFALFGVTIVLILIAAIFFDRFDPSQHKPRKKRTQKGAASPAGAGSPSPAVAALPSTLTPLNVDAMRFAFVPVLVSELKLLLKGQRWWWYAIAGGLFIAGFASSAETSRGLLLPFAWLWPVLIWSELGNREMRHNAGQMVFSSAAPLWRQLPATWLAGFIVTLITGGGVFLRLLTAGDSARLMGWISAAFFIPSFALALGIWSNSHKLFEVLYVTMWYFGPMSHIAALDFMSASTDEHALAYFVAALVLVGLAFVGRARQLQR